MSKQIQWPKRRNLTHHDNEQDETGDGDDTENDEYNDDYDGDKENKDEEKNKTAMMQVRSRAPRCR